MTDRPRLDLILSRDAATIAKHEARAVQALAEHRCACDLTNGFCGPRDGHCLIKEATPSASRNCMMQAHGLLEALRSRGMVVVWAYDTTMQPALPSQDTRRPQDWIATALDGFFADDGRQMPDDMKGALAAKMALACAGIQGEVEIEPFTRLLTTTSENGCGNG